MSEPETGDSSSVIPPSDEKRSGRVSTSLAASYPSTIQWPPCRSLCTTGHAARASPSDSYSEPLPAGSNRSTPVPVSPPVPPPLS